MIWARHSLPERAEQTGALVYGVGPSKWWKPMAKALGIKASQLDAYLHAEWTPAERAQIDVFLAALLTERADTLTDPALVANIRSLAAQFAPLESRPLIPAGADTGEEYIQTAPTHELPDGPIPPQPEWHRKGWEALLADD
jgi:hypothetical protein